MTGPSASRRPVGAPSIAGFAAVLLGVLVACGSAATAPPAGSGSLAARTQPADTPAGASPTSTAASASPAQVAASPTSDGSGYSRGGGSKATPQPTPRATPKATPATAPTPTPKAASIVVKTTSTGLGSVLVGPNGSTLYTLKSDPLNGSGCTGDCAANWPPFTVKDGTTVKGGTGVGGSFGTFARGSRRQVTYKGHALYTYAGDAYAGDTYGNGVGHVWYVAKP